MFMTLYSMNFCSLFHIKIIIVMQMSLDKQVRGKCSVYTLSVSQVILDLLAIIFTLKIIFLLSAAHSFYRLNVDALQLLYVTDLHSRVLITFLNEESFIGVVRCVEWMMTCLSIKIILSHPFLFADSFVPSG